jgi:aminodeoxyfutalosine deaminase
MSVREFIKAIPKVDLNIQLTGAMNKDTLLMVANQNGVPNELKHFDSWVELLDNPDYKRLDEIAEVTGKWVKYSEDIAHIVYDLGVMLSKQNIRYAEVAVAPSYFMDVEGMGIETLIEALNDGRDRALRGWNVDMSWIFCVPRDNPRSGDDVARWATGATARKGNVVALGLIGEEDVQPVGQFRRAFTTARKKDIHTIAHAGSTIGVGGIMPALEELEPNRLTDSWGLHEDEATLNTVVDADIPVVVSMTRALKLGLIDEISDYPLQQLHDSELKVILSSGMPALYQKNLNDEYIQAHEECGLGVDEIVELAKRAIQYSFMDADAKADLLATFDVEVEAARLQYLTPTQESN